MCESLVHPISAVRCSWDYRSHTEIKKFVKDNKVRQFLTQTATLTDEGRYKVKLPWVEDHAPLVTNYDISLQRLNKGVEKLKRESL